MRYKLLGNTGVRVSELCLGTMTFGDDWGWGASFDDCKAMFDLFAQQGGNFIDTSCNYTNGSSEKIIGELAKADRDHFFIATKYTLNAPDTIKPNHNGNSRKNMMRSVEGSLKRLQTDHIDLLYLHAWDYFTPVDEVMRGMDDLVSQGKILYVAFSDTPAYIVAEAQTIASLRGWSKIAGIQIPYSLLDRDVEREVLPMAKHHGLAVMPWGLLEAGILTGKFLQKVDIATRINQDNLKLSDKALSVVNEVVKIADEFGRSPSQVAINRVRQQQHRAQIIPILGARKIDQLKDNLACLEWSLSPEQLKRLDDLSAIDYGFPHSFIAGNPYIYGKTYDMIDNHRGSDAVPVS
jgi:aryl-alcohol dehydrogenase-like predicted oxidoreductase